MDITARLSVFPHAKQEEQILGRSEPVLGETSMTGWRIAQSTDPSPGPAPLWWVVVCEGVVVPHGRGQLGRLHVVCGPRRLPRHRSDVPGPTATEGTNSTSLSNKMGRELESWCSEKQRKKLLEHAMFPALSDAAWVDVFVKYNTAIPSSAAVERLFSQGSDSMKAKIASI
ncbi:hypothetical protein GWK47_049522 [Chionoecetes opilio]|uniref:HAT C-terminal dimerisation domain-containing protein n=1 Tax=Chionoecetes opilio TaxID=41210 RepID=A0A8J4Y2N2_CHIOP|nr:hypothetical protein GWK47_049522 [Chionoecetes opilio]